MNNRATASGQKRATASHGGRAAASALPDQSLVEETPAPSSVADKKRGSDLCRAIDCWLGDGKAQGWSPRTVGDRRTAMERFCWWLENEEGAPLSLRCLSPLRIRTFLAYTREPRPEGRYGSDHPRAKAAARPATANAYFRILRAFSNFCCAEGLLEETPLRNVKAPRIPKDQLQPFAAEQVQALLDAVRRGRTPERDVAIILLLVDSGMRASELCGLQVGDADRGSGELTIVGKGNKRRKVFMGTSARRALWRYLETERRDARTDEALFVSTSGNKPGSELTLSGVFRIVARAGNAARITGVRCSPHTLRHTFAINFLRNGGNLFELQQLMGHEDVAVLRRYVQFAQSDLAQAHRSASPADRLKLR